MKTSSLKYNLMRDIIQKYSLEQIMQLKDRLMHSNLIADQDKRGRGGALSFPGNNKKGSEIRVPGGPQMGGGSSSLNNTYKGKL